MATCISYWLGSDEDTPAGGDGYCRRGLSAGV